MISVSDVIMRTAAIARCHIALKAQFFEEYTDAEFLMKCLKKHIYFLAFSLCSSLARIQV